MVGYAEVFQTVAAMVIFGIILLSANRMIHRNTFVQVEGELEREVVVVAQDLIEEARSREFDENTTGSVPPAAIPEDFTDSGNLGPDSGESNRDEYNDFDDYDGWEDTRVTRQGEFNLKARVFYVDPNTYEETSSKETFKKIEVEVENMHLTGSNADSLRTYTFSFIRNYHAD